MLRAMIDTMVFDALAARAADQEAVVGAIRDKRLLLLTTPVQEHQLSAIPDPARRKLLQRLPREVVPAPVGFAGVSRTGRALLNADAPAGSAPWDRKHAADELIAEAALARADVLVTEDKRLTGEAEARGIAVWAANRLVEWSRREARNEPSG